MPYEVAIPSIEAAIRAVLVADPTLSGMLAVKRPASGGGPAIYNDGAVPQTGALFPYLTIGAWTQVGFHCLAPDGSAGYGWNCTGQFKAVGQTSEAALFAILSRVWALLPHGATLNVSGYNRSWTDEFNLQPTLKTTVSGVTTYEVPAILRVFVS